jgi:hypothetical protein
MKKHLLTLCLSVIICNAYAQIPGYMGLKCSIQYQGGISPQWNNFNQSYLPYFSQNVQIGYVVSRKHEIGLQYTRIDYSSGFNRQISYDENSGETDIVMDHRGFTGNNVMAYIKFFRERKGYIAPLGRYYLLGLTYENSKDQFHVTQDVSSAIGAPNYTIVQSHDIAITAGVGRNIIIANRMLLTIEGDVNIPFTAAIRAGANGNNLIEYNSYRTSANSYKYQNAVDVMLINLVQIKIGLGALVF